MYTSDDVLSLQGLGRFPPRGDAAPAVHIDGEALAEFNDLVSEVCEAEHGLREAQLQGAAREVLKSGGAGDCAFVTRRMEEAALLRRMSRDGDWPLAAVMRRRVERVLDYIDRTADLIPDDMPRIGLLDDAILVELFLRRAGGELGDYEDYCGFRHELAARLQQREALLHVPVEEWLASRRRTLCADRERRRTSFVANPGFQPFRIR